MVRHIERSFVLGFIGLLAPLALGRPALGGAKAVRAQFVHGGRLSPPFRLEVADTPLARARGLMHRRTLAKQGGMLFVFDEPSSRSFWMKDTFVALDMIFLDDLCRIVHVIEHAEPESTRDLNCRAPSRYVVELRAGTSERLGLAEGDRLQVAAEGPLQQIPCPPSAPP